MSRPPLPAEPDTRDGGQSLIAATRRALDHVRDPELDRPVTDLGFVRTVEEHDGQLDVWLQLPTYFCAPNFAYLMVADALDAVSAVPGVSQARIHLVDHFAAEEINEAVSAQAGFTQAFPGQATAELGELRRTFQRKAHQACLERAAQRLIREGWQLDQLTDARILDLPASTERDSLVRRRAELGLPTQQDAPVLVGDDGQPIPPEQASRYLRLAKTTRVSIDANTTWCRGLLATRYGTNAAPAGEHESPPTPSTYQIAESPSTARVPVPKHWRADS